MHTLCYHKDHWYSSNEENSQNKCADLDGNSTSSVTVKSLYKVALHKIPLGGAFVRANIYKLYILHSHAQDVSNVIIINYYHHYDLQICLSFIVI